jgi:hypothetical protein
MGMKILDRGLDFFGMKLNRLPTTLVVKTACYIINEVKESDSASGGMTKVVVVDTSGVRELPAEEVERNYKDYVDMNVKLLGLIFEKSGVSLDGLERLFPKG